MFAYIGMNINSASRPETRSSIKKANQTFREKENHSRANVSCIGFLSGGLFYFSQQLAFQSFTFEKEIMNVLTASIVWEAFLPESNPTRI